MERTIFVAEVGYGVDGMYKVQELQAILGFFVFPIPPVFFLMP